jgi:hypothetical protein
MLFRASISRVSCAPQAEEKPVMKVGPVHQHAVPGGL